MFGVPEWMARSVVILLAVGFLPAMGVAWVFELTPQGFKRDEDVPLAKAALRGLLTTKTARTVRPCWLSWPAGSVRQCSLEQKKGTEVINSD